MSMIQERMNRLFQETMARPRGQENLESGQWAPAVDIFETGDRIVLRADLPGIDQEAIEIRVDDNTLMIRGERPFPKDANADGFHRAERPYGAFMRSFNLPLNVDQSGILASHRNGVLEVLLPKKQESKAKAIRVEVK
jgi:HSP20 family protein